MVNQTIKQLRFSNGTLIYPYIRYDFIRYLRSNESQIQSPAELIVHRGNWVKSFISNLSMFRFPKSDILFFTSTLFNIRKENGQVINSLEGYYSNLLPDKSYIIENADGNFKWRPKLDNTKVSYINSYLLRISYVLARLSLKIKRNKNQHIQKLYDFYPDYHSLSSLQVLDRQVTIYSCLIRRILVKSKSKVLFVNCGCYGEFNAILINEAKKQGIKVIELEHGSINDVAYDSNKEELDNMELYNYLPDEFWSFGDYWTKTFGLNIPCIPVGNPHINSYVAHMGSTEKTYDYLIISQPSYEIYGKFIVDIKKLQPDAKILIRLHPRDHHTAYTEYIAGLENIDFSDSSSNLYHDFLRSKDIVGIYSTCMYESIAFGITPIILDCELSRKYFDRNIGIWIKDASSLENARKTYQPHFDTSIVWHPYNEQYVVDNIKRLMN